MPVVSWHARGTEAFREKRLIGERIRYTLEKVRGMQQITVHRKKKNTTDRTKRRWWAFWAAYLSLTEPTAMHD